MPEQVCVWFCPKPWFVSECEINLKPGGIFRTVMNDPGGERHAKMGFNDGWGKALDQLVEMVLAQDKG